MFSTVSQTERHGCVSRTAETNQTPKKYFSLKEIQKIFETRMKFTDSQDFQICIMKTINTIYGFILKRSFELKEKILIQHYLSAYFSNNYEYTDKLIQSIAYFLEPNPSCSESPIFHFFHSPVYRIKSFLKIEKTSDSFSLNTFYLDISSAVEKLLIEKHNFSYPRLKSDFIQTILMCPHYPQPYSVRTGRIEMSFFHQDHTYHIKVYDEHNSQKKESERCEGSKKIVKINNFFLTYHILTGLIQSEQLVSVSRKHSLIFVLEPENYEFLLRKEGFHKRKKLGKKGLSHEIFVKPYLGQDLFIYLTKNNIHHSIRSQLAKTFLTAAFSFLKKTKYRFYDIKLENTLYDEEKNKIHFIDHHDLSFTSSLYPTHIKKHICTLRDYSQIDDLIKSSEMRHLEILITALNILIQNKISSLTTKQKSIGLGMLKKILEQIKSEEAVLPWDMHALNWALDQMETK